MQVAIIMPGKAAVISMLQISPDSKGGCPFPQSDVHSGHPVNALTPFPHGSEDQKTLLNAITMITRSLKLLIM
jgi:hypothetical protein